MQQILRLLLLVTCGLWVFDALPGHCGDQDQIVEILKLTGSKDLLERLPVDLTDEHLRRYPEREPIASEIHDFYRERLPFDEIQKQVVNLISRSLTSAEIAQTRSFFQSPAGKKVLSNMGLLRSEEYRIGHSYAAKLSRDLEIFVAQKELQQGQAGKYNADVPAPSKIGAPLHQKGDSAFNKFYLEERQRQQKLQELKRQGSGKTAGR